MTDAGRPSDDAVAARLAEAAGFSAATLQGDVTVAPGDVVVGDADGVVVIGGARLAEVIAAARARDAKEASIADALRQGRTTLDVYGWK